MGLLFPLVVITPGLFESEWFLNLLTIPAEYGSFVADAAYLGRLWNLFTACPYENGKKTKIRNFFSQEIIINRQVGNAEKLFTPIGMLLGVGLGVFCLSLHAVIPYCDVFSYFAYILFILGYACTLGGLFNRLASSLDGTRLKQEKVTIFVGCALGLLVALSLLTVVMLTGTMPFITVVGVSKPFIDLLLLHKFLFALPFVFSLTGITTSCFDYFAKAYCFFKYTWSTKDEFVNERIGSHYYEYQSAFFGIIFGCLLASGIIIGLSLTGSLVAAPLIIAATIFIAIIICNNVLAALFSRLGRLIDGIVHISIAPKKEFSKQELLQNKFSLIDINYLISIRKASLVSLPMSINNSAKERGLNGNKIKSRLKRTQSSPVFFHLYNSTKEVDVDNELFFNNTLSDVKSLSGLLA